MNRVLWLTVAVYCHMGGVSACSNGSDTGPGAGGQRETTKSTRTDAGGSSSTATIGATNGGSVSSGGTTAATMGGATTAATMGGATTAATIGGATTAATTGTPSGGSLGSGSIAAAAGGSVVASSAGGSPYANVGVCGERAKATADATSFDGYEERFITGEDGLGKDTCVVKFDLKRVGDAPAGCSVCLWTHLLEYSNPSVVTDTDGVCAKSDLMLDSAAIGKIVGTRVAIGFAKQLGGAHGSARMKYFEDTKAWDVAGNATWDEAAKLFKYNFRDGFCNYGP